MSKRYYVVHYCKNKECNNCWMDKDVTNVTKRPPQWKYCKECCKKLGIDFDSQKVGLSKEKLEVIEKMQKAKKDSTSVQNEMDVLNS